MSPESLEKPDHVPATVADTKQVEAMTRVLLEMLDSRKQTVRSNVGVARVVETLKAYWPLIIAAVSVVLAVVGWISFDVSPFENAREIAHRKQEHRYQLELERRHIELGNDFLNVGQLPAAKAEFTRARELNSYSMEAEMGLLKVSVFEPVAGGDYDPEVAQRRLQAILKQKPNDSHALAFLGDVYRNIDSQEALRYYDQALASDSTNAMAYYGRGILFDKRGETADALAMYEKAVSLSKWNQIFLNNLAYQYYLRGEYKKSENLYVRLLDLDGRFLLSYYMLANSQLMLGGASVAYRNLMLLDARLKDGVSTKLVRNQATWFFHTGKNATIHLYSDAEKSAYAKYLMALACHLKGLDPDVQRYLSEVPAIGPRRAAVVKTLIDADLSRLAKAQPDLASQLRFFSAKFLGVP